MPWKGDPVIVAGSGPSLTQEVARRVREAHQFEGWRVIAVNDAYKLLPFADVLYACDWGWWKQRDGARDFRGERVTSTSFSPHLIDDKSQAAPQYGLTLIEARDAPGFSVTPGLIHYGVQGSSGYQALNLAIIRGASRVVLVGFNYGHVDGRAHFFGNHVGLRQPNDREYRDLATSFGPAPVPVVNATPGSAITCYPMMTLEAALADDCMRGDRAEPDRFASAGSP